MIKIVTLCFIPTIFLWGISKQGVFDVSQTLRLGNQVLALLGFVFMSASIILSIKLPLFEKFFGGLDKMLEVHHVTGTAALIFLIQHPLFLAIGALPQLNIALTYLVIGSDLSQNLGIIALYIMILAFIFMVFIKLPYNLWLLTHRFLGAALFLGSLHALTIGSDIAGYYPLKLWISGWSVAGLGAYIYSVFMYSAFGPGFWFTVSKIERYLDITNIYLVAKSKKLSFIPGQFGFVRFQNNILGGERHPFSFSSDPQNPYLRISVKTAGDYTLNISKLEVGDAAVIYGPYGMFFEGIGVYNNCVFVAGGIGITPFLSILEKLKDKTVNLYWSVPNISEAVFKEELENYTKVNPNFKYTLWESKTMGRITAEKIDTGDSYFLCGPQKFMEDLGEQFEQRGVLKKDIHFEAFNFI